jgi:hypothetical protein
VGEPDEVLEGDALGALSDEFEEAVDDVVGRRRTVEDAATEAWDSGDVFEEEFGVEERRIDAGVGEAARGVGEEGTSRGSGGSHGWVAGSGLRKIRMCCRGRR